MFEEIKWLRKEIKKERIKYLKYRRQTEDVERIFNRNINNNTYYILRRARLKEADSYSRLKRLKKDLENLIQ